METRQLPRATYVNPVWKKVPPFESGSSDEGGAVGYTSPPSFAPATTSSFTPSEEWVSIADDDDDDDDDDDVIITGVKKRKRKKLMSH